MRKPKNNIFSELYFDQYEVNVNPKNIRYFEVEENPLVKVICVLPVFRSSLNFQVNLIEKKIIFTNISLKCRAKSLKAGQTLSSLLKRYQII